LFWSGTSERLDAFDPERLDDRLHGGGSYRTISVEAIAAIMGRAKQATERQRGWACEPNDGAIRRLTVRRFKACRSTGRLAGLFRPTRARLACDSVSVYLFRLVAILALLCGYSSFAVGKKQGASHAVLTPPTASRSAVPFGLDRSSARV
jgi:hypothetical protein